MSRAGSIYARLPVTVQNLAVSVEGWRIRRRRFDARFEAIYGDCAARGRLSPEGAERFRDRRLAAFARQAFATTPHYRDHAASSGFDPASIRSLEDLRALPILRKQTVQEDPSRFVSSAVPPAESMAAHTSGTTGAGLRFPVSRDAHREQWAVWWRYRSWHGIPRDTWCAVFGGRLIVPVDRRKTPYWRRNVPGRQILFSGYHLGRGTAEAYLEELARSRPDWIHGYPSILGILASFALEHAVELRPRWVTTGAENLLPMQEEIIARAFGVRPVQHYGLAEGVANISMCPLRRLHVDEDYAAVEFAPGAGGTMEIVGTNLSNPAFPLIRYATGDTVDPDPDGCSCGLPGRVVRRIEGRREDLVVTRSGSLLGRLDHVFKDQVHVREAQIVQRAPGSVVLQVVRGAGYAEADETSLRRCAADHFGKDLDFEIRYVDHIDRTPAGKLRFVVSGQGPDAPAAARGPD